MTPIAAVLAGLVDFRNCTVVEMGATVKGCKSALASAGQEVFLVVQQGLPPARVRNSLQSDDS